MLEGILVDLLNKYIGKYVLNLNAEDLKVGIWNGKLELTNLQLRPEALCELDLPVEVKAGYIGKITISIPWTSLYSSPFEVVVEDVYVLAGPVTDRKYDGKREKDLQNAIKRGRLQALENKMQSQDDGQGQDEGFVEKLTATVVNNIQVSVQRIHVRYEDQVTMRGGQVFACGLMLDMLEARTTNSSWQPTQLDSTAPQVHKVVKLHGLSVYWNARTPEHSMVRSKISTAAWRNILEKAIKSPHRVLDEDLEFIAKPISTTARLVFNKDTTNNLPKLMGDVDMDEIELLVSRQQFTDMLNLSESFKMMSLNQRYRKYSPGVEVIGHSKAWWRYAYTSVIEEYIRPFSWYRIKLHRQKYRSYKDSYKQHLLEPRNKKVKNELLLLEDSLDVANIVIAREQAKIEIAAEKPERTKKKKKESGWFSWMWGSGDGEEKDDEVDTVIINPGEDHSLPHWLDLMDHEERSRLFEGIGYDQAKTQVEHSQEFVAQKFSLKISTFSLSLINYGREVLKVSLWQLISSIETRPESDGYRALLKTERFIVEGVSLDHTELVQLITSEINVYAPPNSKQLVSCEFEKNPTSVQADYAARLNIQPIEVMYDQHAVSEVIAFFQLPHLSSDDVRSIAYAGFERAMFISRAGLQYAIEQHKTVHLSVNMRSPYIVIPEHGTLHRGGNVVVIDLGKLKVESDLQPKNISLEECTMSEIEARLYDKFNISVSEVKMLLADSGDDWHTAQTKANSEYHLLPSVGMNVTFFNSVQPLYRDLPKHKCEVRVETLELSLSDEKLVDLSAFARNIPVPRSSSMMAFEDCVDGGGLDESVVSVPLEVKDCQVEPSMEVLLQLRRAVHRNSVMHRKPNLDPANRYSVISSASDTYFSASDHSDEEVEDWAKSLDLPVVDDHTSETNTINILARFTLAEVVVSVSKSADKIDTPYLMLRVNRLCADAAVTVYGLAIQASLGGVQLIDKIHLSSAGEHLELFGSKSSSELISVVYRKVEPKCPDFESVYASLEQGMVVKVSSLKFTFDRPAIVYLNTFIQGLLISVQPSNMNSSLHRSTSTILSANIGGTDQSIPQPPSFINRMTSRDEAVAPPKVIKFQLVAKLGHLEVKLCEHENDFAVIVVRDMEASVVSKQAYWKLQGCVGDLDISDLTDNTMYNKVLSVNDEHAVNFKMIGYTRMHNQCIPEKKHPIDGSIRMRIGRMETILLYKFITEIQNFLEPFTNRETVEAYKTAAQQAVHNKIQDVQEQGSRYSICIDLRAPVIFIPQNSASTNVLEMRLGDISLKNYFEDSEVGGGVFQHWDHIYLNVTDLTVRRGKLNLNMNVVPIHTIVEPINLKLDLRRALPPHRSDLHYDISANLHIIKVHLMENDLKVLMAILRENMNEVSSKPEKVAESDLTPLTDVPLVDMGVEMLDAAGESATTPVVEIEEPLLSTPEVSQLMKQTKISLVFDGMEMTLLSEGEDPLEDVTEEEGFAQLGIGKLSLFGTINPDKSIEARLILHSITLTDIRENSKLAIKKLIRSAVGGRSNYEEIPPMVDLNYKQNTDGGQQMELNLDTVRINLCVPYLLSITNFFTKSLNSQASPEVTPTPIGNLPPPGPVRNQFQSEGLSMPSKMLSMTFKQLEVVLFAVPEDKNSRVLVLKANSQCNYFSLQDRENMDARIRQLQIISCVYGRANQTASMVLHPCDLELTRRRETAHSELQMEAKITDVYLNVSASTIDVTQNAVGILMRNRFTPEPVDTSDISLGGTQHYDLWNTRTISAAPWLLQMDEADKVNPIINLNDPAESLKVSVGKVQLIFEVENLDYHVPSLCLKTSLEAEVHDWTKQMNLHAEFCLDVCYLNEKLGVWEPLLEPVMEEEDEYRPYKVIIKVVKAPSHPITCSATDFSLEKDDEIDGTINFLMKKASQTRSDSSEAESDSDNDMTIIRPRLESKMRQGSHSSYAASEEVGFDEVDGPGGIGPTDEGPPPVNYCYYAVIDSNDQLKLNVTLPALDVLTEISQTLTNANASTLMSVHDLPGFEIYNKLEFGVQASLSPDTKDVRIGSHWTSTRYRTLRMQGSIGQSPTFDDPLFEEAERKSLVYHSCQDMLEEADSTPRVHAEALHGVSVTNKPVPAIPAIDDVDGEKLIDIEPEDEVDGIAFLSKAMSKITKPRRKVEPFSFDHPPEDGWDGLNFKRDLKDERMHLKLEDFDDLYNVSHKKAASRLIPLLPCKNDTQYHMHYQVDVKQGRKVVHLTSPLQIHNHLTVPMEVLCRTAELQKHCGHDVGTVQGTYTLLTVLDPDKTYHPPLYVSYHCRLFLTPGQLGYEKCSSGIWWQDIGMTNEKSRSFYCLGTQPDQKPFQFKVKCEAMKSEREPPVSGVPYGCLHIYPPVVLHNLLPYDMQFMLEDSSQSCIMHGDNTPLYTADLTALPKLKLMLCDYLANDWTGFIELSHDLEDFKAIVMETEDTVSQPLSVSVHVDRTRSVDLYIYSPYWIINKTGLPIQIRGSRSDAVYQNDTNSDPLLFRFKKHRRKKSKLRVHNSKWSRSFSLDTVASNGVVICKDKERNTKYQFLLQIQMSHLKLTKIVSIMPYFLVVNNSPHSLRYMEENKEADLWLDIGPRKVEPFWPCTDSMKMFVKYDDSNVASQHFFIHKPHMCTLRMDKGTALCVEVGGGIEAPTTISFLPYDHGDAPVRIDNLCEDVFVKLHQKNQSQVSLLSPSQSVLYTWDDPTAERTLMWNVYNRKKPSYPAFIGKDGCGEVQLGIQTVRRSSGLPTASAPTPPSHKRKLNRSHSQPPQPDSSPDDDSDEDIHPSDEVPLMNITRTDKVTVYWVSYLDGLQRVLLLTQDERISSKAKKINAAEQTELALFISLECINVSLINSLYEELALISFMSGAPIWEVEIKGKWKTLKVELSSWLEHQWKQDEGEVGLEDVIKADLNTLTMTRPFVGNLRRQAHPGLWLQYRRSCHHTFLHTRIHRLQIDNQLCDATFPTVLYPTPLPQYVVRKAGPKPFVEFALIRRTVPEANIDTVKYAKLLVQEFTVRLDRGFLMSLMDMYYQQYRAQAESEQLAADLGLVHRTLRDMAVTQANSRPKRIVFEYLHFSPLKLQVSFSLSGRVHSSKDIRNRDSMASDLLDFFFNSVGATLTEIKEVELRMAYFEKCGALLTWDQVLWDVISHYKAQAIQQAYVLILGLDVLGNPYGLVKDFTQGLGDFFYEPFAGSITSPDQFADNLAKGIRSLMGHTVGSLMGSASLITGSLGQTLAVLSFDKSYRKRRRRLLQQHPSGLPQSLLIGGKGFLVSLGLGLSGVVVNPIRGVKEEGVEGFFKGIGKGLMGLITKPTGGAVDMVSMAFDGLRRAAEMGEDVVVRMRPPRFIQPSLGLKPYSPYQAMGQRLLYSLHKGKYMESDTYFAHAPLSTDERADVLLITDRHIILVEKGRLWSDYSADWVMTLPNVKVTIDKETMTLKNHKDGAGYNPFTADEHTLTSSSHDVLAWIKLKIEQAVHLDDI